MTTQPTLSLNKKATTTVEEQETEGTPVKRAYKKVSYEPPNPLRIPEEVKNHFLNQGIRLRWVRIIDPETQGSDWKNINEKQDEGYEFVQTTEVEKFPKFKVKVRPGHLPDHKTLLTVGDVALMKIPVENAIARQEYFEDLNRQQMSAIDNELRRNKVIVNNKTSVTTGRRAEFAGD